MNTALQLHLRPCLVKGLLRFRTDFAFGSLQLACQALGYIGAFLNGNHQERTVWRAGPESRSPLGEGLHVLLTSLDEKKVGSYPKPGGRQVAILHPHAVVYWPRIDL